MAFLDNSGDIILDAVLTDIGRKKMATGDFGIGFFGLGDDEIDYGLYNKNHPSGSAYYDLTVLETPVLEAFTQNNANINHGLLTFATEGLLYMPSMKLNEKVALVDITGMANALATHSNIFHFAANIETAEIMAGFGVHPGETALGSTISDRYDKLGIAFDSTMGTHAGGARRIYIETGLDTTELAGTSANRISYLVSKGLSDGNVDVSTDGRFISAVQSIDTLNDPPPVFKNSPADGSSMVNSGILRSYVPLSTTTLSLEHYNTYSIPTMVNRVFLVLGAPTLTDRDVSVIAGPRANAFVVDVDCFIDLQVDSSHTSPDQYIRYGTTRNAVFGSANLYDYIDTTIYCRGLATGASMSIPIRIIRYAGT